MDPKKTNNVEPGLLWSEMKLNGNINNSTLQGGTGKERRAMHRCLRYI